MYEDYERLLTGIPASVDVCLSDYLPEDEDELYGEDELYSEDEPFDIHELMFL